MPGRLGPYCQFHLKWTGQQKEPVELIHRVNLLGAKKPYDFFLILLPAQLPTSCPLQGNIRDHHRNVFKLQLLVQTYTVQFLAIDACTFRAKSTRKIMTNSNTLGNSDSFRDYYAIA